MASLQAVPKTKDLLDYTMQRTLPTRNMATPGSCGKKSASASRKF